MDLFINFFNVILFQPLFNALVLLYIYLPGRDFGVAVIVLTFLTRIIFYPLGMKAIKSQKELSELQPKIKEVQEQYKNDKQKQSKALMELYKKEKINPFSGCLPILIQLPILIALYQVFWKGLQPEAMANLYSFVQFPGVIDPTLFGLLNLSTPSLGLAIAAGILQFFQTKMLAPLQKSSGGQKKGTSDFSQLMQKQMLYFFPIFTVVILLRLPSAIALYWLVTSMFSIFQQYLVFNKKAQTV
ncbi:membrane protein insertase YidC [Patescibacteria group bacterium]|nr:membrane protein insertase YidC [Patescibacteria group bacterium]